MLETPLFRPIVSQLRSLLFLPIFTIMQLLKTGDGPDVGDEEPFPFPDNQSKMRRSVENAEHVGKHLSSHFDHSNVLTDRRPVSSTPG